MSAALPITVLLSVGGQQTAQHPSVVPPPGPAFDEIGTIYPLPGTDAACRSFQADGDAAAVTFQP